MLLIKAKQPPGSWKRNCLYQKGFTKFLTADNIGDGSYYPQVEKNYYYFFL